MAVEYWLDDWLIDDDLTALQGVASFKRPEYSLAGFDLRSDPALPGLGIFTLDDGVARPATGRSIGSQEALETYRLAERLVPRGGRKRILIGGSQFLDIQAAPAGGADTTESFDQADSTTLGPDQSWTETNSDLQTVSNNCTPAAGASHCIARCEVDLGDADHWAIAENLTSSVWVNRFGVALRYSSSANTAYLLNKFHNGPTTAYFEIAKIVAGSYTALASTSASPETWASGHNLKGEIVGSDLEVLCDSNSTPTTSKLTHTDTSITGNQYAGIYQTNNVAGRSKVASWRANVVSGGVGTVVRRRFGLLGVGR